LPTPDSPPRVREGQAVLTRAPLNPGYAPVMSV
jgi:hypothetical protein